MNNLELDGKRRHDNGPAPSEPENEPDPPSQGPSLTLLYSLVALALAVAIGLAMLIVLPFYRRAEAHRPVSEIGVIYSIKNHAKLPQPHYNDDSKSIFRHIPGPANRFEWALSHRAGWMPGPRANPRHGETI